MSEGGKSELFSKVVIETSVGENIEIPVIVNLEQPIIKLEEELYFSLV